MVSSWKLDSSSTFHCPAREVRTIDAGGVPILPPTCTGIPLALQNMTGHRRRGGLAVRAGDADNFALQEPARQFQIADDRNSPPANRLQDFQVGGHTRREHYEIRTLERRGFLRLDRHTQLDKLRVRHRRLIHCRHSRSLFHQQLHRRDAATRHPDHDRSRSIHFHRNFSVVSANNAISRPAIQKRMITLDSAHPNCSK